MEMGMAMGINMSIKCFLVCLSATQETRGHREDLLISLEFELDEVLD